MHPEPVTDAGRVVRELLPPVRWAVVTGSVLTAHRRAGSDLDIVVLLDDDHAEVPYRHSLVWQTWPVELFVHDERTLRHYLATELAQCKPSLHRMLATGVTVAGDDVQ